MFFSGHFLTGNGRISRIGRKRSSGKRQQKLQDALTTRQSGGGRGGGLGGRQALQCLGKRKRQSRASWGITLFFFFLTINLANLNAVLWSKSRESKGGIYPKEPEAKITELQTTAPEKKEGLLQLTGVLPTLQKARKNA